MSTQMFGAPYCRHVIKSPHYIVTVVSPALDRRLRRCRISPGRCRSNPAPAVQVRADLRPLQVCRGLLLEVDGRAADRIAGLGIAPRPLAVAGGGPGEPGQGQNLADRLNDAHGHDAGAGGVSLARIMRWSCPASRTVRTISRLGAGNRRPGPLRPYRGSHLGMAQAHLDWDRPRL